MREQKLTAHGFGDHGNPLQRQQDTFSERFRPIRRCSCVALRQIKYLLPEAVAELPQDDAGFRRELEVIMKIFDAGGQNRRGE